MVALRHNITLLVCLLKERLLLTTLLCRIRVYKTVELVKYAVSDLLNKFELFNLLLKNFKAPDNSVLCVKFSWMSDNMCSNGVESSRPNHVTSNNDMQL